MARRKRTASGSVGALVATSLKLPKPLVDRIDALAAQSIPPSSRAGLITYLIELGLPRVEEQIASIRQALGRRPE